MKKLLTALLAMCIVIPSFANDEADDFSPAVPLEEALDLAKAHVKEKKINTSTYFLKFVELKFDKSGKNAHWHAQWMGKSRRGKGDWFIIRVDMDKQTTHLAGM